MTMTDTIEPTRDNSKALTVPAAMTPAQLDAMDHYAQTAGPGLFGDLLKHSGKTGEWTAGPQGVEVPHGTELVAIVPEMLTGWVKWVDGELADQAMVPVYSALGSDPRAHRATLDETDRSKWPLDDDGRPRDPWQEAVLLPMVNPKTGAKYSLSTCSVGGVRACKQLSGTYSRQMRAAPETTTGYLPLVAIGTRSYKHSDKKRGTIFNPVLEGVDWVPATDVLKLANEPAPQFEDHREPKTKKKRSRI
jgi:hypothetical protein